ncbi:rho guanine nucleotide exchange factor 17-like [Daktulosphaira vitifoliae]|uniref:rho guanine nucleotide exchange factor 17-like n=1 Tax=Daktulosphaira vitifoliae TaxID=58002 RepID=UPI0021A9ADF9|nr:rho guanine nucleotide exchange factor 17-like [Daktulosphaira vitifoliae]
MTHHSKTSLLAANTDYGVSNAYGGQPTATWIRQPQYFSIGSVRVRFGPITAKNDVIVAPSINDYQNNADTKDSSCCCGVTSRIPLPTGSKNRQTTGATCLARIQAPVYRSSLDWSNRVQKPSGCFGKLTVDRVPLVTKAREDIIGTPSQDQETTTLDRFQKFRFGGRNGRSGAQNKKNKQYVVPRTTDKTDRLRKLTDKLKQPPAGEVQALLSKVSNDENSMGGQSTSTANLSGEESSDTFEDGIRKPESRTIVGSYYQRSIPFRSASFSQVYYSPTDGKYIRADGRKKSTPSSASLSRKTLSSEPTRAYSQDNVEVVVPTPPIRKNKSIKSDPGNQSDVPIIEESFELSVQEEPEEHDGLREKTYLSEWKSTTESPEGIVLNCERSLPASPVESPKEEPLSVKYSQMPQWSSLTELPLLRPKLSAQSSEEKEEDKISCPSPKINYRQFLLSKADSFSEGDSDQGNQSQVTSSTREYTSSPCNDNSDSEKSPGPPVPYTKRPLRGPYLEMIVNEKKKPEVNGKKQNDLNFLEEFSQTAQTLDDCPLKRSNTSPEQPERLRLRTSPKRKISTNLPISFAALKKNGTNDTIVHHQRTTSSPSQLEGCARVNKTPEPSPQLLAQLLKGSSEKVYGGPLTNPMKDTRTHVVVELYDTERSYVESLQTLVNKYLLPLKSPENSILIEPSVADEIFYQIPEILMEHEKFLKDLHKRLEIWDAHQRIGDILLEMFSKKPVIDSYTSFINNWKQAKEAIKATCNSKPAFARYLESTAREHKGKLALDSLLIMPVQRIPRYELLIQTLLKHTESTHPDHESLIESQKQVHEMAVKINCTEKDNMELEQIESLIDGLIHLAATDRTFLRHDLVTIVSGQSMNRKERALFLFSDLLIVTSIKKKSGTIRKPSTTSPNSIVSNLEANKYKLLMKIPLDDVEIVKVKDDNVRRMLREMEYLSEDISTLTQMTDMVSMLHCPHGQLEDSIKDMLSAVNKQLSERQASDTQLCYLELNLHTRNGTETISIMFSKPEKRTNWEESFTEAKQKLVLSTDRRPNADFVGPVPIRKTRAGLQFTCAAPALNQRDVWVCNSDGYVGQVCVLSLYPEPTVTSCNGVCNARILCVTSIPAPQRVDQNSELNKDDQSNNTEISISIEDTDRTGPDIKLDSSSSEEEEEKEINHDKVPDGMYPIDSVDFEGEPTMWLGTEDGCIHVYNSMDNIRIKRNKVKIQHGSAVHCIIYFNNRAYVSLANGDICIYYPDTNGSWNTSDPVTINVGSAAMPVSKMLPVGDKLWCSCHNTVKILDTNTLQFQHTFVIGGDSNRSLTNMVVSGMGVWLSLQNSAVLRLVHSLTYEVLAEVNTAPAVTKMLSSCDDIIRQHKAACLRVTSLLAVKDLLWIGTSAGVVLTMSIPAIVANTSKLSTLPVPIGVPHGHTGHVRFLTLVGYLPQNLAKQRRQSLNQRKASSPGKLLLISGGDGYEDFRSTAASEVAGREDSTNHLLLWHV